MKMPSQLSSLRKAKISLDGEGGGSVGVVLQHGSTDLVLDKGAEGGAASTAASFDSMI